MADYIFNNTALSNFALIHQIDLLKQRYAGHAYTTIEVAHELRRGIQTGYTDLQSAWEQIEIINPNGWLHILTPQTADEYHLHTQFDTFLDAGEAACLALAVHRQLIFVTDDRAARQAAKLRQVKLTGTVGILINLVRDNTIPLDKANQLLKQMIERRYRSPVTSLDDLV